MASATLSAWEKFRTYINSLEDGSIFTRKDLFQAVYGIGLFRNKERAADHYRHYLTILHIVERVGFGKYKKIKSIPVELSSQMAQKLCYDKTWKSWFINTIEERIEAALNEKRTRTRACKEVPKAV